jgi:hypothetical protein
VVYLLLSLLAREAGGRKGLAGARGTSEQKMKPLILRKFASFPTSRLRLPIPASLCVNMPTVVIFSCKIAVTIDPDQSA